MDEFRLHTAGAQYIYKRSAALDRHNNLMMAQHDNLMMVRMECTMGRL